VLTLLKRNRELIVVSLLLLYPLASFLAKSRLTREPNILDRAVLGMTSPLQRAFIWTFDGARSAWNGYIALRGVRAENLDLREQNRRLRSEANDLAEVRAENDRLKKLLAYSQSTPHLQLTARVLGVNPAATLLSLRIDRGEADGLRRGMPVVTPDGVVGTVQRVTGSYADVVLVTDPNSRIGVKIQRSRVRATATGKGENRALQLDNALRTEDLKEGDQVVTSGTDGVFPPGLSVGRITSLRRRNYGMVQNAEIAPAVDMTKLEEVLVIRTSAALPAPTSIPQVSRGAEPAP
jgi:rod shape-determining protein MreC